jgi:ATP-dependent helicase/nuclease subunit B
LLGPSIERLDEWFSRTAPVSANVLSRPARELVLAEALRKASPIYAGTDPWLLSDQLLTLFDELSRFDLTLPADFDQFHQQLQHFYQVPEPNPALQQEAHILHTLWYAWKQQLEDDNLSDPVSAYRKQLEKSLQWLGDQRLWLVGFTEFSPAESRWLAALLDNRQAQLILHGNNQGDGYHPDRPLREITDRLACETGKVPTPAENGFGNFIDGLFSTSPDSLLQRAQRFAGLHEEDIVAPRLKTFRAGNQEQEAQAVTLQIRRWLLEDRQPVAVITEDRRLARRVRALLEAAQIELEDSGGWALSTTSAAATVERWLEALEEDFACGPLLDVLKSPFVCLSDRDSHLAQVRRLEQDIIVHENVTRGLERYRHHLDVRSRRLPDWSEPVQRAVHRLLNAVDHAASPLLPLLQGSSSVTHYLEALAESLRELSAWQHLEQDAAGQRLLEVLDELRQAATVCPLQLDWSEFRSWLGSNLERTTFRVPSSGSPVQLLTLSICRAARRATPFSTRPYAHNSGCQPGPRPYPQNCITSAVACNAPTVYCSPAIVNATVNPSPPVPGWNCWKCITTAPTTIRSKTVDSIN